MSPLLLAVVLVALLVFLAALRPDWTWLAVWSLLLIVGLPPVPVSAVVVGAWLTSRGLRLAVGRAR